MTTPWKCDDCSWVKVGDYCVCPQQASDPDCHCIELVLMTDPGGDWRGSKPRCEDAPCCGCCDAGLAVMPG